MKIAILGAGAMGSLYGGWLSLQHVVWLIDLWQEHIKTINVQGLTIDETNGASQRFYPNAVMDAKAVGPVDLVLVFVKSIDTAAALTANPELFTPQTIALSLQNGWGNAEDILPYVPADHLVLGTTSHGATILGPGQIRHAGRGQTHIGSLPGCSNAPAQTVWDALSASGFETYLAEDVRKMIWSKLFANIAINPVTALLNVCNGYLVDHVETLSLLENLVHEAVTVSNATGMNFDIATITANVIEIARLTSANRSSMLQDVTHKRRTEIERMNGAIVALGQAVGVATPYNTAMSQLIKALEQSYLR